LRKILCLKDLLPKNIALKIFDKISPFVSFSGEEVLLQLEVTTATTDLDASRPISHALDCNINIIDR